MISPESMLDCLLKEQLVELAAKRGLPTGGYKGDLISRLLADVAKGARTAAERRRLLVDAMRKDFLARIVDEIAIFHGGELSLIESAARTTSRDALIEAVLELCEAPNRAAISELLDSARYRNLVAPLDDDDDDDDDDGDLEVAACAWNSLASYKAGPRVPLPNGVASRSRDPFPYQRDAIEALRSWMASDAGNDNAGVLCLPTGAGKTFTAMSAALTGAIASSKRVLWLAHRVELIDQAVETALQLGARGKKSFTIARFQRGELRSDEQADLVFATLPVLSVKRDNEMPNIRQLHASHGRFDLIVVDECHHGVAAVWSKVIKSIRARSKGAKLLGLSATPSRGSDEESAALWKMFGRMIHVEPALKLIGEGYLARPRAVIVRTHVVVKASKAEAEHFKRFRDLQTSLVKRIEEDRSRADLIVDTYDKQSKDFGKTLIFVATVEHAKALCRKFAARGIEAAQLTARDDPAERRRVLERFKSKDLDVLINVMLFTEGTDLPLVQTVFVARPTRSRVLFQQMVGRAMRGTHLDGTEECIVVAFQDRITNLLEEQLASTFETEREALLALGIDETRADDTTSVSTRPRSADSGLRSIERDLDELREWIANERGQTVVGQPVQHELAGWWEIADSRRTFRLPVFGSGRDHVAAWIEAARLGPCSRPAETGIPAHAWGAFAEAMAEGAAEPKFISTESVRIAELEAFAQAPFGGEAPRPAFDWLAFAEASVARPPDSELLIAGARVVAVPSSAVHSLEASLHDLLAVSGGGEPERAFAVRFAARQAARTAGLDESLVEELLHGAMAAGALQRPSSMKPTLREAAEILDRTKNRDDYKRTLQTLHATYFASTHPEVVDLIAEIHAHRNGDLPAT